VGGPVHSDPAWIIPGGGNLPGFSGGENSILSALSSLPDATPSIGVCSEFLSWSLCSCSCHRSALCSSGQSHHHQVEQMESGAGPVCDLVVPIVHGRTEGQSLFGPASSLEARVLEKPGPWAVHHPSQPRSCTAGVPIKPPSLLRSPPALSLSSFPLGCPNSS
jgi:hypothetical protein